MNNRNYRTRSNPSFRLTCKGRGESGSTLVMVTVFMIAIFAFAALSLDVGNVLREQRKENTATDAGALAAVAKLPDTDAARQEAIDLAGANGVTSTEIQNAGTVEVGLWSNSTFTANATPFNAVRVPARRRVPLNFGGIVGMRTMNPAVHSVANISAAGGMANPIPFGVTVDQIAGKGFGYFMTLNSDDVGTGKQGKVDLRSYQNVGEWQADMTTNGCNCQLSVGSVLGIPGNAGVKTAIQKLGVGSVVAIPVIGNASFTGNNGKVDILGFVVVQITSFSGSGSNWKADVMFLNRPAGGVGGGSCLPPCVQARALVQ